MTSEQAAELLSALTDLYHSRLTSAVGITLALYDSFLMLPREIETVYQSRWSVPKVLYFYIRYITPFGILLGTYQLSDLRGPLSGTFCTAWAMLQTFGMLSSLTAATALLSLRLVALYRRKTYMVWFIHTFFAASYITCLGLIIQAMVTFHDNIYYSTILGVCGARAPSTTFTAVFYSPAAFELFVFTLTAVRGWQDAKVISGIGSAPFLLVLYRDGFISFVVMTALRVWNIWIYVTQPLSTYNLGTMMMWSISTVLTTRVYMNLVWLAKKPVMEATSMNGMPMRANVNSGTNIRMRVNTFTEVQTDNDWNTKRTDTLSIDDGLEHGRVWSMGASDSKGLRSNWIINGSIH